MSQSSSSPTVANTWPPLPANMSASEEKLHIVMLPWLAFGHMIPYLELAKLIAKKGHRVSFVSTPRNIDRLPKLPPNLSPLLHYVKLPLSRADNNLPDNAEATSDVPLEAVRYLKKAHDTLQHPLSEFLESSNADWVFHDFVANWVGPIASKLGIKTALLSIFTAPFLVFFGPARYLLRGEPTRTKLEDYTVSPHWVPFPSTLAYRYFEIKRILDDVSSAESGVSDLQRYAACVESCDLMAVRGCTQFEPEWFQLLRHINGKPVLPVGQLPSTGFDHGEETTDTWRSTKEWLDKQERGRVVYVAFGSEAKPSQEEVTEIALGLEKSGLPFFWVLRVRRGPYDTEVLRLPEGFEERTEGRGIVCTGWAPQLKILGHPSVGGFLTHSGWTSVVEAVQNEKPLVLLTFLADQGINAKVLEEKQMGYLVPRDELDGSFTSDSVAESLRIVVVGDEGRVYRENIKEVKDLFVNSERQERYVDDLLHHLQSHLSSQS